MNLAKQLQQILRDLRRDPVWQHLQGEHRQQVYTLLDELQIEGDETIFDLAVDEPEKLIVLGQRLAKLERDKGKPGQKPIIPEGIPTFAVAIACERSGLTHPIFVGAISDTVAPWDNETINISLSTLERAIKEYKDSNVSGHDLEQAKAMADEIIKRIKALPNSLI